MNGDLMPRSGDQARDVGMYFALISAIVRRVRFLLLATAVGGVLGALVVVVSGNYRATTRFVPQGAGSDLAGLSGVVASLGLAGPLGEALSSPDFFASLVGSRSVLAELGLMPLVTGPGDAGLSIAQRWEITGEDSTEVRLRVVKALERSVRASVDVATGVVTVSATASDPALAESIGRGLIDLITRFNLTTRQSRAGAERVFVEGRLEAARASLEDSEDSLRQFMEENRAYGDAARLLVEQARRQRAVELRQQVYIMLSQALEQARIDEVRDTPVITVIDPPEGSAERTPSLRFAVVVGAFMAGLLALAGVCGAFLLTSEMQRSPTSVHHLRDALAANLPARWRRRLSPPAP